LLGECVGILVDAEQVVCACDEGPGYVDRGGAVAEHALQALADCGRSLADLDQEAILGGRRAAVGYDDCIWLCALHEDHLLQDDGLGIAEVRECYGIALMFAHVWMLRCGLMTGALCAWEMNQSRAGLRPVPVGDQTLRVFNAEPYRDSPALLAGSNASHGLVYHFPRAPIEVCALPRFYP